MNRLPYILLTALAAASILGSRIARAQEEPDSATQPAAEADSLPAPTPAQAADSAAAASSPMELTGAQMRAVADSLGVDVAAIKAVINIEAGPKHQGMIAPGQPLASFSLSLFRRYAAKRGINIDKYAKQYPAVFAPANKAKYGSRAAAVQARIDGAMAIDSAAAIEATYWGMFQIGGFNYKLCKCSSPQQFYSRMAQGDGEQLLLFANFLQSTGLDQPMRDHNWSKFARGYNGPSYAKRGYHTRLAKAYKVFSNTEHTHS